MNILNFAIVGIVTLIVVGFFVFLYRKIKVYKNENKLKNVVKKRLKEEDEIKRINFEFSEAINEKDINVIKDFNLFGYNFSKNYIIRDSINETINGVRVNYIINSMVKTTQLKDIHFVIEENEDLYFVECLNGNKKEIIVHGSINDFEIFQKFIFGSEYTPTEEEIINDLLNKNINLKKSDIEFLKKENINIGVTHTIEKREKFIHQNKNESLTIRYSYTMNDVVYDGITTNPFVVYDVPENEERYVLVVRKSNKDIDYDILHLKDEDREYFNYLTRNNNNEISQESKIKKELKINEIIEYLSKHKFKGLLRDDEVEALKLANIIPKNIEVYEIDRMAYHSVAKNIVYYNGINEKSKFKGSKNVIHAIKITDKYSNDLSLLKVITDECGKEIYIVRISYSDSKIKKQSRYITQLQVI